MAAVQFLLQLGETEKSYKGSSQVNRVVGDDSHVIFGKEFPNEK
jgi:hypothetical protein